MRQVYTGVSPDVARARLGAMQGEIEAMRLKVRPMGPEYLALSAIADAIKAARPVLTGKADDPARLLGASTPRP
jgi:hypothetical protein